MSWVSISQDRASESLGCADPIRLAQRYVGAYIERDLEAMLAVMDENVVSYPAPLFGHRPHLGHDGVREWWAAMMASEWSYDVRVSEIREIEPNAVAVIGEVHSGRSTLSPWAVVVRIRNGLIVESRSYLSSTDLLEELGLLGD